ncbi:MAG: leucine-rich repeat domain-containing protein, partial [Thermoguttaceae bacterium]|nr:leucine-rich repeat domain-containing protein [Thermoguttaceae bacterium]
LNSCESLTKVSLPNSLTTIGDATFAHCKSLAEIAIPDGVEEIAYAAFADCPALVSITLPPALATIGKEAFRDCASLKTVYFPTSKGPKKIAPNAFKGCSPDLTLCGPGGSVAEKFAAKKEIRFEPR